MKWWHVLVVIIGIVIGSILLKNRHILNKPRKKPLLLPKQPN